MAFAEKLDNVDGMEFVNMCRRLELRNLFAFMIPLGLAILYSIKIDWMLCPFLEVHYSCKCLLVHFYSILFLELFHQRVIYLRSHRCQYSLFRDCTIKNLLDSYTAWNTD
jgi:hypothetical protein